MADENRYSKLFARYNQLPFVPVTEQTLGHEILALTPDPSNPTDLEKAELFAFQFVENYKDNQDDFFKPHRSQPLPDGSERVYPDINEANTAMIDYWQQRSENSDHPVVKARYAGLVHEFSMRVSNKKTPHTASRIFANALHLTVIHGLIDVFIYKTRKLQKALSIAIGINDTDLINEIKNTILQLEQSVPLTETKNFWTFSFDTLFPLRKTVLNAFELLALITRIEQRFVNFLLTDKEAAWEAAVRLCIYYNANQDKVNIQRVLAALKTALNSEISSQPIFQKIHWLERLYKSFSQYGFRVEAVKILTEIRGLSRNADSEMKSVSGSATISQTDIDILVNKFLEFQGDQLFVSLSMHYSLDITAIKNEVEASAKENGVYFIFPKELLDAKGRKIGTLPGYREAPEPYLTRQAEFRIKYNALFFRFIMDEGIKRGIITTSEIMKFITLSPIFEHKNIAVIEKAVTYFLASDFLVFIHLVIPQLEEAIRNLVEASGGNVLVTKDNVYMLKTFDHLLNDPITVTKLGTSTCFHFKALLTDKTGMNLRNDVAHGIIDPDKFDVQHADALMIALLILVLHTIAGVELSQ